MILEALCALLQHMHSTQERLAGLLTIELSDQPVDGQRRFNGGLEGLQNLIHNLIRVNR